MKYLEEREFVLRLEGRCEFPDDYEGDDDGYAWTAEFEELAAAIVQSAVATIGARASRWTVRPRNRGRSSRDEVILVCERAP